MHTYGLALVAFLAGVSAASGAGADKFGEALAQFPQAVLSSPDPIQLSFVDMTANRADASAAGNAAGLAYDRLDLGMVEALGPITNDGVDVWERNAGISVDAVSYFAGTGQPPQVISVWGLIDAATADGLFGGLAARGFGPVGGGAIMGNGEPLAMDMALRETGSPWRDALGRATFIGRTGSSVIQSSVPEGIEPFLSGGEKAADHPVVATGLAALDAAAEASVVRQAVLISPAFGLQASGMAPLKFGGTTDFDQLRAELEAEMAKASEGIPPYFGGIIADVEGDGATLVMTLVYADCDTAGSAAELIKARWARSMPEIPVAPLQSAVVAGAGGLCGVSVSASAQDGGQGNPLSRLVIGKFMGGQFDVLQIGPSR